jgi:hypothetical protein
MSRIISKKIFVSTVILFALFGGLISQGQAWGGAEPTPQVPTNLPSSGNPLFLPLVGKGYPAPPPVYGVELLSFSEWKLDKATQANVNWVRYDTFSWAKIEPTAPNPGHTYDWNTVNNAGLIEAAQANLTVIAVVKNTPTWAQKPPGHICGPIASSAWGAFYDFVYQLVSIYSAPPYNIRYFEFGNEPDADTTGMSADLQAIFGCWANPNDKTYYGGEYYAEMLKRAYPAVKAANPQAIVLNGGLLLDCDPRYPPPGKDCLPAQFLEGILHNQGAAYFDVLTFHSYPYYGLPQDGYPGRNLGPQIVDENNASFAGSGGQLVGKVDYLRYVMGKYGINKPIMMTEVGLQCKVPNECVVGTPPSNAFLELQADYVVQTYTRSWGLNLLSAVWYTLEDSTWNHTGLFTGFVGRPGYNALVFMTNELKDTNIGAPITQFSGLRGYEFTNATKRIWVLWAPNGITGIQISPTNVNKIYDKYGNPITPIPSSITITHPTYIEFLR